MVMWDEIDMVSTLWLVYMAWVIWCICLKVVWIVWGVELAYTYDGRFWKVAWWASHALNLQGHGELIPQPHYLPPHFELGFGHFIFLKLWRNKARAWLGNLAPSSCSNRFSHSTGIKEIQGKVCTHQFIEHILHWFCETMN